jgi:ABC-2 type transport system permease protein
VSAVSLSVPSEQARFDNARKLVAFLRRDFLIAWSYRMQFFTDAISLALQAFMFYFVGRLVDPSKLPSYGGTRATYMEFVGVGIALSAFMQVGLSHVASAIRKEQLTGTLESLLMTPTSTVIMQIGSVVYDLLYVPLRTAGFLAVIAIGFGVHFRAGGILPSAALLLVFIPFVWGLGIASAASALTFRRGGAGIGFGIVLLSFGSGAYFPIQLLPHWIAASAGWNPMAITVNGMRTALLGHISLSSFAADLARLAPLGIITLIVGLGLFKRALRREQRRGTLGLY